MWARSGASARAAAPPATWSRAGRRRPSAVRRRGIYVCVSPLSGIEPLRCSLYVPHHDRTGRADLAGAAGAGRGVRGGGADRAARRLGPALRARVPPRAGEPEGAPPLSRVLARDARRSRDRRRARCGGVRRSSRSSPSCATSASSPSPPR